MDYILHILIIISIFSILSVSLNYIAGYVGILSLSHASFYGVGAYGVGILMITHHFSFLEAALYSTIITGVIAYLTSVIILRLRGEAVILVSIGVAFIFTDVMFNWTSLTRGPRGLPGIPSPEILAFNFYDKINFLVLSLIVLILVYIFFSIITNSTYGVILKGIRDNEKVASVSGHDINSYRRSVFTVGACAAALAGGLFASYQSFIDPKLFELFPSALILIMVILGGMGNLKGSILGAAIIIIIPEVLRFVGIPNSILAESQQIIYGLILVILMYIRPQGILGEYKI